MNGSGIEYGWYDSLNGGIDRFVRRAYHCDERYAKILPPLVRD